MQNELILVSVLDVIYETILSLLRGQLDRRTILDNLELVLLTIDEVVCMGTRRCFFQRMRETEIFLRYSCHLLLL